MCETLKDCPFCGKNEWQVVTFDCEDREGFPTHYSCQNCGACAPWAYSRTTATTTQEHIEMVNTRPIEDALRAELAEAKELAFKDFLQCRDVDTPCKGCNGFGVKTYASTSTWMGGIGGSALTNGVCDKCWGSGDENRQGVNLKEVVAQKKRLAEVTAENAVLRAEIDNIVRG